MLLESQVQLLKDYKEAHNSQQETINVRHFELTKYQSELAQSQSMYNAIFE